MFTNQKACTIYEKAVQNRAPIYIRHTTGAVYWEESDAQAQSNTSRTDAGAVFCSVPVKSLTGYLPKKDDRIVKGICEAQQPPNDAYTIMSVKDFRYGSLAVQHIEITAE